MTKWMAMLAILFALAGWVLMGMTGYHLLSGDFANRTCQTGCVKTLFWSALALAVLGLAAGLAGVVKRESRVFGGLALFLAAPLAGIAGGIIVIGTTQGPV